MLRRARPRLDLVGTADGGRDIWFFGVTYTCCL